MSRRSTRFLSLCAAALLLAACAAQQTVFTAGRPCAAAGFSVSDGFSGSRRGTCTVLGDDHVLLDIRPEDDGKINDSPWYAFRIHPANAGAARISLRYHNGHHRYAPKISSDGLNWQPLDPSSVEVSEDGRSAAIAVPLDGAAVYVAAQELVTPAVYDAWNRRLAGSTGLSLQALGESRRGLPIHYFDANPGAGEVLLIVGRQHPPEVTGAFAFLAFAETVFGESGLARSFRDRFRIIAIPLLNPDGVDAGHWRHNLGHKDINRDWGPFTQPETRLVAGLLDRLDREGHALRMFIDFHSTQENVFYTQQEPTRPPGFTRTWLERAAERIEDYPFRNGEGPSKNAAVAKNYIYSRYRIPAVTFEVGDETDRDAIRAAAVVFAEELMRLMLATDYAEEEPRDPAAAAAAPVPAM